MASLGLIGNFLQGALDKGGEINDQRRKAQLEADNRRAEQFDQMNLQDQLKQREEARARQRLADQAEAAKSGDKAQIIGSAGFQGYKDYTEAQATDAETAATKDFRARLTGAPAEPVALPSATTTAATGQPTTESGGLSPLPEVTQVQPNIAAPVATPVNKEAQPEGVAPAGDEETQLKQEISKYNAFLIGAPKTLKDGIKAHVDNLQEQLKVIQTEKSKNADVDRDSAKDMRKANIERFKKITESSDTATKARGSAQTILENLPNAGYMGTGAGVVGAIDKVATGLNPKLGNVIPGEPSAREVIDVKAVEQMLAYINDTKGAVSDKETAYFIGASPNKFMTKEGAYKISNMVVAAGERANELKQFMETWLTAHNQETLGMDEAWRNYVEDNPALDAKTGKVNHGNLGKWKDYLDDKAKARIGYEGNTNKEPQAQPTQVIDDPKVAPDTVRGADGRLYKKTRAQ